MRAQPPRAVSIATVAAPGARSILVRAAARIADRLLALDRVNALVASASAGATPLQFVDLALSELGIGAQLFGQSSDSIAAHGPAVIVANHPFGGLDGLLLAQLLLRRRPDVRILTNRFLAAIPQISELFIGVDVFSGKGAVTANAGGVRKALRWIDSGGLLAMFPAGEVSHLMLNSGAIIDPVWPEHAARIIRISEAPVTPVYFSGRNSWLFQLCGLLHPRLRTTLLPRELLKQSQRRICISIGREIPAARIAGIAGNDLLASHLRLTTYGLAEQIRRPTKPAASLRRAEIAAAGDGRAIAAEVDALGAAQSLAVNGDLAVYVTSRRASPHVMQEIGRLREQTFRGVGEGSGNSTDIDSFDDYYEQLFIWNREAQEIAGAYRLGRSDQIIRRLGLTGLYTHRLFEFRRDFFAQLRPALELGRSFVCEKYQRSFTALMLLWRGIAGYVAQHPEYTVLFGAVSVSNDYHPLSKEFLKDYLVRAHYAAGLARCVKARNPVRRHYSLKTLIHPWTGPRTIDALSDLVSALEPDGKDIPVLMRQYLRLGGAIAGFNVDPDFSDSIDCLLVVDLLKTEPRVLARYMGTQAAAQFAEFHALEGAMRLPA